MECIAQSDYKTTYQEFKNYFVSSKANNKYKAYCKRAYQKARRRYDKMLIEDILDELSEEDGISHCLC